MTKPTDYTFEAGHLIGLQVQTEIVEWSAPKVDSSCVSVVCNTVRIDWEPGRSRVILPVVGAGVNPKSLFAAQ